MTVALPLDENPDITLRQPSVGRLASALRRARRERRFVTIILNARVDGMELETRGRFSWLSSEPVRRYAKRCIASLSKARGADIAAVQQAEVPEHIQLSTALKAINQLSADPCPRTGRTCVWTDGIAYYVQQWSVAFPVGVEHLPELAEDEWWACTEFDHAALQELRDKYGKRMIAALRELRAVVRSRERGGILVLTENALEEDAPLRWCKMSDDKARQIEERLKRLRAPSGSDDNVGERARKMLLGERVSMTRALKEDPNGPSAPKPSDA